MARRTRQPQERGRGAQEAKRRRGSGTEKEGSGGKSERAEDYGPDSRADSGEAGADRAEEALGRLVVVSTPIGNLGDLSTRALEALTNADVLACEDTSVGARLLAAHGVRRSIQRLDEHSPEHKIRSLLDEVSSGKTLAFFSDAGTPGVSDPGAALVDAAHARGIAVDAIPGPSAVMTALALSGFYAQRFVFLGFLPRKAGAMSSEFAPYADSTTTLVYFEAPTRLKRSLVAALTALGDRRLAVCREMTKSHQEIVRATLSELICQDRAFKGECTIVIEGMRRRVAEGS